MKKVVFPLFGLLFATYSWAQESQTEYNFLRIPVSAHAAALGGDNISIIENDASLIFSNTSIKAYQVGSNSSTGAAGDVILCPTADGYRIYMYFYDYHCQSIGAYVADCIKIEE